MVLIHRKDELDDFDVFRRMVAAHMLEGMLYQFFDLVSIQKAVIVGIIFLEDEADCFLYLCSAIADFVILGICLMLGEFTIKPRKGTLVLAHWRLR